MAESTFGKKKRRDVYFRLAVTAATRAVSQETIDLVQHFEGLELTAYQDEVGVWTIGYGHTADEGPPLPGHGMTITEDQAVQILAADLARESANVENMLAIDDLNDSMFGALVSFSFNLGDGNLHGSTLLHRVNDRRFQDAILEFPKWNHAGGKVYTGLTRRRLSEANLFCSFPDPIVTRLDLPKYKARRYYTHEGTVPSI